MKNEITHLHDDLIDRCLDGDRTAFEKIYKLYSAAMFNICYRITGDENEAEDVLQEAFVNAFSHLDSYNKEATFGAWLKRIVVNKAINHIKKRRIQLEPLEDQDMVEFNSGEDINKEYDIYKIKKAIEQLPDGYRIVFSLYLLEGYDHSEIGEILGISESTSKSQYNRSKKKLRELLS